MTTHSSATIRGTSATSYSATIPPNQVADAGLDLQSAPSHSELTEVKERTAHAHRSVCRPGRPPDGGA